MVAVVLTIHVIIVLALIGVVLVQRSDGAALGIGGGGGGGGGFMSGRGAANALTRTTSILAAGFFATSLGLAIFAGAGEDEESIIQDLTATEAQEAVAPVSNEPATAEDLLNTLGSSSQTQDGEGEVVVPASDQDLQSAVLDAISETVSEAEEAAGEVIEETVEDVNEPDSSSEN